MNIVVDELRKNKVIVYDCEVVSMIPGPYGADEDGYFYCNGWEDYVGMGISVVALFDFVEMCAMVFLKDNLDELNNLLKDRNWYVGYNNIKFDNPLLRAHNIDIDDNKSFDLHGAVTGGRKLSGFKLNDLLAMNGIPSKSDDPCWAPKYAQKGKWGRLINYCLQDVYKTARLFTYLIEGHIILPHGANKDIKLPWKVEAGKLL